MKTGGKKGALSPPPKRESSGDTLEFSRADSSSEDRKRDAIQRRIDLAKVGHVPSKNLGSERGAWASSEKPPIPFAGDALIEFATETSMHGAKRVVNYDKRVVARVIWLLLVLGMTGGMIFTTVDFIFRYLSHPYTTTFSIKVVEKLPLPGVTICLQASINREKLKKYPNPQMLTEYFVRNTLAWFDPGINQTSPKVLNATYGNLSVDDIMDTCSPDVSDVVKSAMFGVNKVSNISQAFRPSVVGNKKCFSWNTASFKKYGYQPLRGSYIDTLVIRLQMNSTSLIPVNLNYGISVFIHDPLEFVPGVHITPYFVPPNSTAIISLKVLENIFLPEPYSSFGGKQCIEDTSKRFDSTLGQNITYTWGNCIRHNAALSVAKYCHCVTGWTRGMLDYPTCNLARKRDCYDKVEPQTLWFGANDECQRRCSVVTHEHSIQVSPMLGDSIVDFVNETLPGLENDNIYLVVKFGNPLVTVTEHKPALNVTSMFSLLGGQMGFFLGASLLTVAEFLELMAILMLGAISRLCCCLRTSPQ